VRAVRAHPRVDTELSVNFAVVYPDGSNTVNCRLALCTVSRQHSKDASSTRVFPDSDGALADYRRRLRRSLRWVEGLATFLLESLILAQDERWRRA
jgi:hypothetical protein